MGMGFNIYLQAVFTSIRMLLSSRSPVQPNYCYSTDPACSDQNKDLTSSLYFENSPYFSLIFPEETININGLTFASAILCYAEMRATGH